MEWKEGRQFRWQLEAEHKRVCGTQLSAEKLNSRGGLHRECHSETLPHIWSTRDNLRQHSFPPFSQELGWISQSSLDTSRCLAAGVCGEQGLEGRRGLLSCPAQDAGLRKLMGNTCRLAAPVWTVHSLSLSAEGCFLTLAISATSTPGICSRSQLQPRSELSSILQQGSGMALIMHGDNPAK